MLTGVLSAGRVPCMDEHAKKRSGPSTSTPPSASPSLRARKQQRHQRNAVVRTNNKDARKAEFRWMHQSESIWRRSRPPPLPPLRPTGLSGERWAVPTHSRGVTQASGRRTMATFKRVALPACAEAASDAAPCGEFVPETSRESVTACRVIADPTCRVGKSELK